jgi:hypothetical protein
VEGRHSFKGKPVKIIHLTLLATLFCASAAHSEEEENRYNVLGRLIRPFVSVFAKDTKSPNRAFTLTAKLEMMTDLPAAFAGSSADLELQYPDKLKIHAPFLGDEITVCRNGQDLWAYPGAKVDALLNERLAGKKSSSKGSKDPLGPFEFPIPEKELVLAPVLFQVKDVGTETLDDARCRVLDLYLMPELAHSLKAQGWAARVWVRDDGAPARISFAKPGWQIAVRLQRVEFLPKLPPETWQPTAEQSGDVLKLDPARFRQLMGGLVKDEKGK